MVKNGFECVTLDPLASVHKDERNSIILRAIFQYTLIYTLALTLKAIC